VLIRMRAYSVMTSQYPAACPGPATGLGSGDFRWLCRWPEKKRTAKECKGMREGREGY
jgi:hypothetical protein